MRIFQDCLFGKGFKTNVLASTHRTNPLLLIVCTTPIPNVPSAPLFSAGQTCTDLILESLRLPLLKDVLISEAERRWGLATFCSVREEYGRLSAIRCQQR